MTAGLAILKSLSWSLRKKRSIGEAGVNQNVERKKYSSSVKESKNSKIKNDSGSLGNLEIVAPSTSDVEFKYNWPVERFVKQVKACKGNGITSNTFKINVNGISSTWKLSLQFWVDGQGSRLANPAVLCLNLVGCRVATGQDVTVKYKFGIYNQNSKEFEMGSTNKAGIMLEETDKLQSIGYKNIAISDKHLDSRGDVMFSVRLSIIHKEEESHSLSSDLSSLINDQKSADCILQAGDKTWQVHSNILAARSPVFAKQLSELDENNVNRKISTTSETLVSLVQANIGENVVQRAIKEVDHHDSEQKVPRKESTQKLVITDFPSDTVEELLRYIYTDNSTHVDTYSLPLLAASEQYQLPGLKLHCEKHLAENLSPLNVAEILLLSDNFKCAALKKTALAYCGENHSYIMKDSGWKKIEEENPSLFSEAISTVAPDICDKHQDCIEKGGNRYATQVKKKQKQRKKSLIKRFSS